jgi:hypothetical protein
MTIPKTKIPIIFWRPNKRYGLHKMCNTNASLLDGNYLKGNKPPNYPVPAINRCAWCDSTSHTAFGPGEYCPDRKQT